MSNCRLLVTSAVLALTLGACATGGHEHAYTYSYTPPADPIAQEAAFLAKNAKTKGVISLPGLQYMVLQSGPADGPHPKRSDDITVRYEGRFLNGKVFNTSPNGGLDPITFPLEKLIPGWGAALQMMRPGDVWMLYIPANLAYGEAGKSYIPPYSTLIFRVELVAVAPHPEPAPPAPPQQPAAAVTAVPVPPPPPPPPPPPAATASPAPAATATTEAAAPAKPRPVHHHKRPKPRPAEDGSDAGATSDEKGGSAKSIFPGSER